MTGQPNRLNVLDIGVDNNPATTTIQFRYELRGINEGTQLCIGLEEMHILSVSGQAAGSTAVVIRAFNGSTIASHSAGDVIQVAPQFSDYRISKYLNQALLDLSTQGLFKIESVEFTFNPATLGYNLNTPNILDIWRIRYKIPGPTLDWPVISPDDYRLDLAANTTDFTNGRQLYIYRGGYPGHPVRVSYRTGFNPLVNLADDVLAVSGLHTEAHDIPPLGAAIDLLIGRDVKRSFLNRQPEPRRQEEVPPGAATQSIAPILKTYNDRIVRETRRLNRQYPKSFH
jgi:hypothetical protein